MLWACLWLPSLALDSALRQRKDPAAPLALVSGPARQRRLLAVNAPAHAAGLHPGQRLTTARAICPSLQALAHDPRTSAASLQLVAALAYRYSAEVRLDPPRAVSLEISRSLRLFGSWPHIEARLRGDLEQLGLHHRIALAPNPQAARALARNGDGQAVTTPAQLPTALANIPLAHTQLPPAAIQTLAGIGLHTLGPVLRLPRAALRRRCGPASSDILAGLLGARPTALASYRPPARFDMQVDLGCEIHHLHGLWFPLKRMLGDLATHLAQRDGGVQQLQLALGHGDRPATRLTLGLRTPERAAPVLFELTCLRLQQTRLPAPVTTLALHADHLPPLIPAARDLFDPGPAHAQPWPQLAARLRARLGEDAVCTLATDPDPRPERASIIGTGTGPATTPGRPQPARPTWLLPRPIPLHGPRPTVLAGPERLETGWWDDAEVCRDYYVLELAGGQQAWAFCAPGERGPFMLHGWFA